MQIQMRMEMIAHLKDQLQEMKAKTSMEKKYIKKVCNVSVLQTQKMCNLGEKDLKDQIDVRGLWYIMQVVAVIIPSSCSLKKFMTKLTCIKAGTCYW